MDLFAWCPLGCYSTANNVSLISTCSLCPAGNYSDVLGAKTCRACSAGSFNPEDGATHASQCRNCSAGTYNPEEGATQCRNCSAGTYNPEEGASLVSECRNCSAGTYNPGEGAAVCRNCPPGSSCPYNSRLTPCACKVFEFQPLSGQPSCLPCPLPSSLEFSATTCRSTATSSNVSPIYYHLLVALFFCIAVAAVVVAVRMVRARRSASLRTVHAGMCMYVATFAPYALLQAITLSELAKSNDSLNRATTEISSSIAFATFFGLGFSGKVALVQLWAHVVHQHSRSGLSAPHRLQNTLTSTYKAFVWAVVLIVAAYLVGFTVITVAYLNQNEQCARFQSEKCLSSAEELPQPCSESAKWTQAQKYYEGVWAGVVLVVFTSLAFLFNGVVFAMCVCFVIFIVCSAILCDAQQADGRTVAVEAAVDAGALAILALACAATSAQRMDRRQLPDDG